VFRLMPSNGGKWKETKLYWFSNSGPGASLAGLLFDSLGNLFGTTIGGDSEPGGSVFRLKRPTVKGGIWILDLLYGFKRSPDGAYPAARLVFDQDSLYATTVYGGIGQSCQGGCGTVYEVSP
jgi:hypothetical protein